MSSSSESPDVKIARLEVQVKNLEANVALMNDKLDDILERLSEAKGGWKTLMWLGGAAASAGGAITWVLNHVSFHP